MSKKTLSQWAGENLRFSPHSWSHERGTNAISFAIKVLTAPAAWYDWARKNFPDGDENSAFSHLEKEVEELRVALMNYRGSSERAEHFGGIEELVGRDRKAVQDEAADVAILAMRVIQLVGADPYEAILSKWEIVSKRVYVDGVRKVEPSLETTDHQEIIKPSRYVITLDELFLAETEYKFHWTKAVEYAFLFDSRETAEIFIQRSYFKDLADGVMNMRENPKIEIKEV